MPVVEVAALGRVERLMFVPLLPGTHWLQTVFMKQRRRKNLKRRLGFLTVYQYGPLLFRMRTAQLMRSPREKALL